MGRRARLPGLQRAAGSADKRLSTVFFAFLPTLALALAPRIVLGGEPVPASPPWARILCTPDSVELQGQKAKPSSNPIADALRQARPGSVIELDPGTYPPFTMGFQSNSPANVKVSGEPGQPIVVAGKGPGVQIYGVEGDTIAIDQAHPVAYITFRNLAIVPGKRAGVMFYQRGDGRVHRGFTFEDCDILGRYDHLKGVGKRSRWGVWGHRLVDFRFAGVSRPARIEDISDEHAFYLLNCEGTVTIERVHASNLGRTFCQFTARAAQGPPGTADVVVRDCVVEDACISRLDGFKGGAAFTLAGRLPGTFLFENNVYKAGFREPYRALTTPGRPYGTGAFAAWESDEEGPNGLLVLRDNQFGFATGCGDRPVVSIGACARVLIVGQNRFHSGSDQPALELDPVNRQGKLVFTPNGPTYVAPATRVEGPLLYQGHPPTEEERAAMQLQPGSDDGAGSEGEADGASQDR